MSRADPAPAAGQARRRRRNSAALTVVPDPDVTPAAPVVTLPIPRGPSRLELEQRAVELAHRCTALQRLAADEHRRRMYAVNLLDGVLAEHTGYAELLERVVRAVRLAADAVRATAGTPAGSYLEAELADCLTKVKRAEKLIRKNASEVVK